MKMKCCSDTNFNKGFTLLELLIVVVLISIVFSIGGMVFINNLKSFSDFNIGLAEKSLEIGFVNQLSSQMFSKYEGKPTNFVLTNSSLSFYTYYPVIFDGLVRAEYTFEKDENGIVTVKYEEFPYVDGKLGTSGLKEIFIGKYNNISIEVLQNGVWEKIYKHKKFPQIVKLKINSFTYYITVNAQEN